MSNITYLVLESDTESYTICILAECEDLLNLKGFLTGELSDTVIYSSVDMLGEVSTEVHELVITLPKEMFNSLVTKLDQLNQSYTENIHTDNIPF